MNKTREARTRHVARRQRVAFGRAWQKKTGWTPREYVDQYGSEAYTRELHVKADQLDFDKARITREAQGEARERAARRFSRNHRTGLSKVLAWASGEGVGEAGEVAGKMVAREVGDETFYIRELSEGTMGGFAKGALGRAAGTFIKGMGALEIGMMAARATGSVIGAGYKGMIRAADRLDRQVGRPEQMSTAYRSRAASTERQRARRELQDSKLNPRTQLRGNEAFFLQ